MTDSSAVESYRGCVCHRLCRDLRRERKAGYFEGSLNCF